MIGIVMASYAIAERTVSMKAGSAVIAGPREEER